MCSTPQSQIQAERDGGATTGQDGDVFKVTSLAPTDYILKLEESRQQRASTDN